MILHGSLLAWQAVGDGFTRMEPALLATGLYQWRHGRFDTFRMNPPPERMLAALPAYVMGTPVKVRHNAVDPRRRGEFYLGWSLQQEAGGDAWQALKLGRLLVIPISLFGMLVAIGWSRQLFGRRGGLLSGAIWAFLPEFLGHAHLITADMAGAVAGLWFGLKMRDWLNHRDWASASRLGLAVGIAILAKPTWFIAIVMVPAIWLLHATVQSFSSSPTPSRPTLSLTRTAAQVATGMVIALFTISLFYGFDGVGTRLDAFEFASADLGGKNAVFEDLDWSGNRFSNTWIGSLPCPLPAELVRGIDLQRWDFQRPRRSYLFGEWADVGWWYYYFLAWAVKLPIGSMVLMVLGVVTILLPGQVPIADRLCLLIPMLMLLGLVSSQTGLSKHLRYGLPVLAYAAVAAGATMTYSRAYVRRIAAWLCFWSCLSSLWIAPHSLAYFNEFAGGPLQGHRYLTSSNLDWDQDLPRLIEWLETSTYAPQDVWVVRGSNSVLAEPFGLKTRLHTIATEERWPVTVPSDCRFVVADIGAIIADGAELDYLLNYQPIAQIGYGFRVYRREQIRRETNLGKAPQGRWSDAKQLTSQP